MDFFLLDTQGMWLSLVAGPLKILDYPEKFELCMPEQLVTNNPVQMNVQKDFEMKKNTEDNMAEGFGED